MSSDNIDSYVSFSIDSFIEDKDSTIWICKLSDGSTAYMDDNRPDHYRDSWSRLRKYCYETGIYVKNMSFKFRSHIENIYTDENNQLISGFFFTKAALFGIASKKTENRFVGGVLIDNILYTKKFVVPELVLVEEEARNPETYWDLIIKCTNHNQEKNAHFSSI